MVNPETLLTLLRAKLGSDVSDLSIHALKGDASNRSYYRLYFQKENRPTTMVLMELAEPEAFKKSEEAVSVSTVSPGELPYLNILRHLARSGVSVPELYGYDPAAGLVFLEDLGDVTLEMEVKKSDEAAVRRYYRMAIDQLLRIHGPATENRDSGCIAFGRAFDAPLLMWEFDHFIEYGIEVRSGMTIRPGDRKTIREEFLKISEALAAEPKVFTHRDYHSRNLMIHKDRIWILDFQDALLGPRVYDLASLLRDSYYALPDSMVDELIDYYFQNRSGTGPGDRAGQNRETFRRMFDLMSLQRNLKAAGRFVYIDVVKKKNYLLPYIPQTLGYVRNNLNRNPGLKRLRDVLEPYVQELGSIP